MFLRMLDYFQIKIYQINIVAELHSGNCYSLIEQKLLQTFTFLIIHKTIQSKIRGKV